MGNLACINVFHLPTALSKSGLGLRRCYMLGLTAMCSDESHLESIVAGRHIKVESHWLSLLCGFPDGLSQDASLSQKQGYYFISSTKEVRN